MDERGFIKELRAITGGERCLAEPARLLAYECDGLTHFKVKPLAVVLPETTAEVCAVVRACNRAGVPFTPRGAGTGLSGGAVPPPSGILIELARMNRILRLDAENRLAVVQPGVVNARLSQAAAPFNLCYAPDPSSQTVCTLGGNVAENSGGPHCLKHGATTNHILALKVVLAGGDVVRLGSPLGKNAGLDLRGVFLGSEGTMGIVTEITCRLVPIPGAVETLLAPFATIEAACRAVSEIVAAGILPSALEALDERTIAAVEASVYKAGYPEGAGGVLLVELDGPPAQVAAERAEVTVILERCGAFSVEAARDPEHRAKLWKGRKGAFGAMGRLAPDLYVQDAVVPRSKLPEVLVQVCAICDELGLKLANVFHAGEGNLHPNICYDGRDPGEVEKVIEAGRRIMKVCLEAGGALSGEHGIGLEKQEFMPWLFSADDLETMSRVRAVFNPRGLLNPGKVLPSPRACVESRPARPPAEARA
jgi:glycolate oxidase subunit GlcD